MNRYLTIENGIYFLIFLLGLSLRTINLGNPALTDFEARWALSALQVSQGSLPGWSMMPLYEMFTGVLFFMGGANGWLARLLPAVGGSLLVLSPALFRPWLGKRAALICAFGLAFDPALTISSRLIGSPILAITFGVFAAGFWLNRKSVPAATCLGLALLGGPHFWIGLIPLGLAVLAARFLVKADSTSSGEPSARPDESAAPGRPEIHFWILTGACFLAAGTLFLRFPQGLGSFAQGISAFFQGWITPSGFPFVSAGLMLALFQPLALIFGLVGAGRAWLEGNPIGRRLSVWFVLALIFVMVYPARQPWDLAWAILPLWALASLELEKAFEIPGSDLLATCGQTALILILAVLAWLNFAGILITEPTPEAMRMRWILIAGVFVLGMLATVLVGMGWSFSAARTGLTWGAALGLAFFVFSSSWAGLQIRSSGDGAPVRLDSPAAQWVPAPAAGLENLLTTALGDLAERRNGNRHMANVVVVSRDPVCETCLYSPSIRWALRDIQTVRYVDHLGKGEAPEVVITPADEPEPSLVEVYRGQSIGWWVTPEWQNGLPADWVTWILKRTVPARTDALILWARSDTFPGGENVATNPVPAEALPAIIQPVVPPAIQEQANPQ